LDSTHVWKESADGKTATTCGVVKVNVGAISFPISIAGATVATDSYITGFGPLEGDAAKVCDRIPYFEDDVLDYTVASSLVLSALPEIDLPKWMKIENIEQPAYSYSVDDFAMQLVDGKDVEDTKGCSGLPANKGTVYTLLRFKKAVAVTVGGVTVMLPAEAASSACLLLDVCTNGGCAGAGGVAFMLQLPSEVTSQLKDLPMLKSMAASGLTLEAFRLGVGGAMQAFPEGRPTFWNGDEMFTHCSNTAYNFFVGGKVTQELGGGGAVMHLEGGVFLALPLLCGDTRDILNGGEWSIAATASVTFDIELFLGAGRVFRQKITIEDAIGSHACSLEALTCV
jgi:hypothetical protein